MSRSFHCEHGHSIKIGPNGRDGCPDCWSEKQKEPTMDGLKLPWKVEYIIGDNPDMLEQCVGYFVIGADGVGITGPIEDKAVADAIVLAVNSHGELVERIKDLELFKRLWGVDDKNKVRTVKELAKFKETVSEIGPLPSYPVHFLYAELEMVLANFDTLTERLRIAEEWF